MRGLLSKTQTGMEQRKYEKSREECIHRTKNKINK